MVFFALGQKDATSLCRKSEPEFVQAYEESFLMFRHY
jgi:hypothetical protein